MGAVLVLVLHGGRPALCELDRGDWGGKASLLCLTIRLDTSKSRRKWRGQGRILMEVMIKFIESWNNVLKEECDI